MAYALDRSRDAIFVERLHAKTMARSLAWARGEHAGRYQVRLGEFLVEIGEGAGPDDPEILICGADGQAIEILTGEMLADADQVAARGRRQAFVEIYEAARRMALGVDQVIDGLITALAPDAAVRLSAS
jgi:hypothetical protein